MIVDCYTRFWDSPHQVGIEANTPGGALGGSPLVRGTEESIDAGVERHLAACEPVDKAFVLGFESAYLDARIPNDQIAEYTRQHPDKLIGFAGIDPSFARTAIESLRQAHGDLGMRGVSIAPAAQDCHPSASQALKVYEVACELKLPILFDHGPHLGKRCKLEYARPVLLDEVAREFPELRMVIAHLGYPWMDETLILLAKHPGVYADLSWLLQHPWQAYQTLLACYQHGVMGKLLFGSGFPYTSAASCIEALYSINHLVQGTNLPTIPREELRSIVERDSLDLLGIGKPNGHARPERAEKLLDEDA